MDPLITTAVKVICVSSGMMIMKTKNSSYFPGIASCEKFMESETPEIKRNMNQDAYTYSSPFYSIHYSQSPRLHPGHLDRYDVDWSMFAPARATIPNKENESTSTKSMEKILDIPC